MLIYVKYKFVIGGFDFLVYKGLDMASEEVAIYWYFYFE
ncbi:streptothricin acetyltransferase [Bacillus cereus]|nr:streptothricin acetyltransferase [Bacillus cereus]